MNRSILVLWLLLASSPQVCALRAETTDDNGVVVGSQVLQPWPDEELAGGETTVFDPGHSAFGRALRNLDRGRWLAMRAGKRLFESSWLPPDPVWGPGSRRGLGPRFNEVSCSGCHFRDGRGAPPEKVLAPLEPAPPIVRLGREVGEPDPNYGAQINDQGIGVRGEGEVAVSRRSIGQSYVSGRKVELWRLQIHLAGLTLGSLHPETKVDLRVPPTLVGLGLLEAVPVSALEALADPDDRDGDGISGRLRRLVDGSIGRFGWKATQPDLRAQVAAAFLEDLGVTSSLQPRANCGEQDLTCRRLTGDSLELSKAELERVTLYTRLLAPPARRGWDEAEVLKGREVFLEIGCDDCHLPMLRTAKASRDSPPDGGARSRLRSGA